MRSVEVVWEGRRRVGSAICAVLWLDDVMKAGNLMKSVIMIRCFSLMQRRRRNRCLMGTSDSRRVMMVISLPSVQQRVRLQGCMSMQGCLSALTVGLMSLMLMHSCYYRYRRCRNKRKECAADGHLQGHVFRLPLKRKKEQEKRKVARFEEGVSELEV